MSFTRCINGHALKGFLTEKQARDLNNEYEKLLRRYTKTLGDEAGAHQAAMHFVTIQQKIIQKRMENDINHALALKTFKADLNASAAKIGAEKDKAWKHAQWLHGNPYMRAARDKMERIYERQMSITREALIEIADTVETFRSKAGGFKQDVKGFIDVLREAGGESTGNDAARAHGKAVRQVLDRMRDEYEDVGGVMGKIENYLPVHHEAELVGKATFEEWADYLMPLLDREKMIDLDTGLPLDDAKLNKLMKNAYENIKTHGLVDIKERADEGLQTFGTGGEINMRRSQSRFFHFKNVDSYIEYNQKFGRGEAGLFDAIINHIESMGRDIAIMQHMGPKPTAIMRNLELEMRGRGVNSNAIRVVNGMYDVLSAKNQNAGQLSPFYKFTMGWLNVKRSAYLGSAPIAALSDTFFISMAARMNGIPAMETMGQYLKLLNPADSLDREVARDLFYVSSAVNGMGIQGARFADDVGRGGTTAFLAGMTNRLSGLGAMTDAGRVAPMMVFGRTMARYVEDGTKWTDLDPNIRKAGEKYGFTEKDWDYVLSSDLTRHPDMEGSAWLMPENIMGLEGGDDAARKYGDWMVALGNEAVNEPKLLTRTITSGNFLAPSAQGSTLRLMAANVFFAKSFPVTIILNQLLPSLRSASQGRFGHLVKLVGGATVMGSLALQLREIIKGKEPMEVDGTFVMRAMLQGGGAGLFGDFLLADYNRFGQSLGGTIAGPIAGTAQSLLKAGDLYSLAEGEWSPREFASDVFKVGAREIPGVNLWYSRLVIERMMLDQVERMIDPKYDSRIRRLERKMKTENGQEFWWRPAELSPEAMQQ